MKNRISSKLKNQIQPNLEWLKIDGYKAKHKTADDANQRANLNWLRLKDNGAIWNDTTSSDLIFIFYMVVSFIGCLALTLI